MCICDVFSWLGLIIGELMYGVQKITQCLAFGSVLACLAFSFTVMLMVGVGLGYNHCYVEGKKGKSPTKLKSNWFTTGSNERDSEEMDNQDNISNVEMQTRLGRNTNMSADASNTTTEDYPLLPTMVIPLNSKNNILKLIRRIRKEGQNITIEFISK